MGACGYSGISITNHPTRKKIANKPLGFRRLPSELCVATGVPRVLLCQTPSVRGKEVRQ